jgi:hypothetical protein
MTKLPILAGSGKLWITGEISLNFCAADNQSIPQMTKLPNPAGYVKVWIAVRNFHSTLTALVKAWEMGCQCHQAGGESFLNRQVS